MANTVIKLKRSGTSSSLPSSLEFGELALNYADGKLFYKASNGTILQFSSGEQADSFGTVNANGTLIVADSPGDILTFEAGSNIIIEGDGINDKIRISATGLAVDSNVSAAFNQANAAYDRANTKSRSYVSNTTPTGVNVGDFWWNSDTGTLYVYYSDINSSQWVQVHGGVSGGQGSLSRSTVNFATSSISDDQSENLDVTVFKTFSLMKIVSDQNAWIRFYSDPTARTDDQSRSINTDATAGSGLLAEFILTANVSQRVTPFIVCGNLEDPVSSNVYVRVTNLSGNTVSINITITVMGLET